MNESPATARSLAAWMDVLGHIDRSLADSLARTPEPEPAAAPEGPVAPPLARLDDRLAAWRASLEQAGSQASASTELLNAEHAALSEWLDKLGRIRDGCNRWLDASQL